MSNQYTAIGEKTTAQNKHIPNMHNFTCFSYYILVPLHHVRQVPVTVDSNKLTHKEEMPVDNSLLTVAYLASSNLS